VLKTDPAPPYRGTVIRLPNAASLPENVEIQDQDSFAGHGLSVKTALFDGKSDPVNR
jgi:hypothetical protein